MKKEELLKILLAPHFSEKASYANTSDHPQYVFRVSMDATKSMIKNAIEQLFSVRVRDVNVLRVKGAIARKLGRVVGQKSSWKKAYVVLEAGQEINLA
ncbi:MAG TPA: 50S ribosomal protein L23 [Coxiellaceae bacterium]|nr:50S ribosomal protein L23 [Coxiellaceae bacterium]